MEWNEWAEAVDTELEERGKKPRKQALTWLYREGYYDGFSPEEALEIAYDTRVRYRKNGSAYRGSTRVKPGKAVDVPIYA